jgi:gas vesicle protein
MSSTGKFLTGFVIGGAIGAIAGILLAPKSGKETREELAKGAKEAAERTKETVKEIQNKADKVTSDLQKKGEEIKGQLEKMLKKEKKGKEE